MTNEDYEEEVASVVDLLAMPGVEDVDFEPPRQDVLQRPADLE